jgi:prevent-host-death family protein
MAQFDVQEGKINLLQLLEMASHGQEVILARNGEPVAKLVAIDSHARLLGIGVGDPNYRGGPLTDEQIFAPLAADDLDLWEGETSVPS